MYKNQKSKEASCRALKLPELERVLYDLTGSTRSHTFAERTSHFLSLLKEIDAHHVLDKRIVDTSCVAHKINDFHNLFLQKARILLYTYAPPKIKEELFNGAHRQESAEALASYIQSVFDHHPENRFDSFDRIISVPVPDHDEEKFRILPPEIGKLRELQAIMLHGHNLTSIPRFINRYRNMQMLDFSCNTIRSLPDSLGDLPRLRHFTASRNEIRLLPSSFPPRAPELASFYIQENPLKEIPEYLPTSEGIYGIDFAAAKISSCSIS